MQFIQPVDFTNHQLLKNGLYTNSWLLEDMATWRSFKMYFITIVPYHCCFLVTYKQIEWLCQQREPCAVASYQFIWPRTPSFINQFYNVRIFWNTKGAPRDVTGYQKMNQAINIENLLIWSQEWCFWNEIPWCILKLHFITQKIKICWRWKNMCSW